MKSGLLNFAVKLAVLTVVLLGIHVFVFKSYYSYITLYYPVYLIYIFQFVITLAIYTALYFVGKIDKSYVGMGFLVGIFVKMMATFIFFLPFINKEDYNYLADILNFFIPYFIFLSFETVSVVKLIRNNNSF